MKKSGYLSLMVILMAVAYLFSRRKMICELAVVILGGRLLLRSLLKREKRSLCSIDACQR